MFSVLFEVHPKPEEWDAYLGYAKSLRPELEAIDGFIDNIRYRSLTRDGWVLSLSGWRDEKALVRWRTLEMHHGIQERGRIEVFLDYHLRVGQVTSDTCPPSGLTISEQRLDETEVGAGTAITLIDASHSPEWIATATPEQIAQWLGMDPASKGLLTWDVFEAVLAPGDVIVLLSWQDQALAETFEDTVTPPPGARVRRIRVVRDYGMFDRREAPQYYPDAKRDQAEPS